MLGIVLVYYYHWTSLFSGFAVITPLSYSAYLEQSNVRFNCSASSQILWFIDGYTRSTEYLHDREIKTVCGRTQFESFLEINSTIQNNNTNIQCAALKNDGSYEPSKNATFLVQGQFTILTDGW